jgi:hypothetical protein
MNQKVETSSFFDDLERVAQVGTCRSTQQHRHRYQ